MKESKASKNYSKSAKTGQKLLQVLNFPKKKLKLPETSNHFESASSHQKLPKTSQKLPEDCSGILLLKNLLIQVR